MNLFELATRGVDLDALPAGRSPERESAVSAPVEFAVPQDLNAAFDAAADEYGVDADVLRAMAYAESRFRPDVMAGQVKSRTGATGLMQFMPETAKRFGIDPTDPVESIFGAAAYMRANLEKFDGDYDKAVAAYNWGENRQAYGRPDWKDQLPQETRGYLGTVFGVADELKLRAPAQPESKTEAAPKNAPQTAPETAKEPAPIPERTWGEAFGDTTKSLAQGLLDVGSLPGVAYSAVTGDWDTGYLKAIRGTQEVLQDQKSAEIQARNKELQSKLSTAEGWREKLAVGGIETLKDPTLLFDTLARSAPGMFAGGGVGRGAGAAANAAGNAAFAKALGTGSELAARIAVTAKNGAGVLARATATGTAAGIQGASVASDTYDELSKLPVEAFKSEPEWSALEKQHGAQQAKEILAGAAANRALLMATGASVLSMKLVPGGDAIEKMFLPKALKGEAAKAAVASTSLLTRPMGKGMDGGLVSKAVELIVKGSQAGALESVSEGVEEGTGAIAKGLELSRAGQRVSLSEMAGEAYGQGAAAGLVMGKVAGMQDAYASRVPTVENQPTVPKAPVIAPAGKSPVVETGTDVASQILQAEQAVAPSGLAAELEVLRARSAPAPDFTQRSTTPQAQPGSVPVTGGLAAELQALRARSSSPQEVANVPQGTVPQAKPTPQGASAQAADVARADAPVLAADIPTATDVSTTTQAPGLMTGDSTNAATPANDGTQSTTATGTQGQATGPRVILQNRDRSTPSSIAQMRSIAARPDYGRLGFSRDFANGAPVVAGGTIQPAQMGRKDVATASDGRRIPVQYAVVDAGSVLASNTVDGSSNTDYGNGAVQAVRAIAGNGRIAGLQAAYQSGNANAYRQELVQDAALHGIAPEVIAPMANPVLVRVMPDSEVTADIGDISNTVGNLDLSAVEQANNDANRVQLDALQFADDGSITTDAVRQFVRAMPQSEQGQLLDTNGQPTRQAVDRLSAAVFAKAYGNEALTRLYSQAQDPEARLVMSALAQVAPKMARLEGAGALDVRDVVAQAAEIAVNARRQGVPLAKAAQQMDMAADPDVGVVLDLFASNARSVRPVVEALARMADMAYTEASKPAEDMFGAVPRASRTDILNTLRPENERGSQEALENAAGREPVAVDAVGQANEPAGSAALAEAQASRPAEDAANPEGLTSYTAEEATQRQEEAELAAKAEAARQRAADQAASQDENRKRIAQASVRAAAEFELGQNPLDSLTGQGSMFDDAPEQPASRTPEIRYELPPAKSAQQQGDESWMAAQSPSFKPTARQQLLMDAVAKALDDGAFYSRDVVEHVAKTLGVTKEQRARNSHNVEGGDFGYDVYNASKAVEAQRGNAKSHKLAKALNLKPGDVLGTLVFNDGKVTTGVKVVSLNESGLVVTFTGKRGAATLNAEARVDSLAAALDRAHEKGKRKDSYEAFIAGRAADKQATEQPPARTQQAQAATETVAQSITRADVTAAQQQARADNRKKVETKEDDAGNVVKFSRSGAQSANANDQTSRSWYDRFVSLLPDAYRNDPHRREPLPAEDWNVQRAAEVHRKVEALNQQLRGENDRKGYGPISIDGLGNLQVSALQVSRDDLNGPIKALAKELGAGIAITNVRTGDIQALQDSGFVPETSLAPVADRIMGRPFDDPANRYAADARAYGTIMTYQPRGFPAVMFARDAATQSSGQPLRTPAATIRAAITKAYGKLLGQLESKGLVTLTQTEDEAIEAAARARADKTGQSVERERDRLQASIRGEADELSMSIYSDEAGKIERALDAMGLQVSTEGSRISQSTYVIVESPEYTQTEGESGSVLKIRVSDHRLPGGYQRPDFEVQVGNAHHGVDMADAAGAWFDAVSWVGRRFGVEPKGAAKRQIAAAAEKEAKAKQAAVAAADQQRDRLDASKARLQAWLQSLPDGALWGNARRGGWVAVLDGKMIGRFDGETATGEGQPWYGGPYPVEAQKNLQPVRESLRASVKNSVADPDIRRSANGAIQGFFDPQTGQSFLVADNLTAEAAPGVLMHEVGIHMAADGSMKALFNRAAMMLKLQRGNPFMKAVQARMDAAGETSGEEAAAYIAEAYENDRANAPASVQRWLADLLAAVKAWMFKKGIMGADRLTVADIAAVARANARTLANGVPVDAGSNGTRKGGGLLYSIQRDKQGMPVIEGDGVTLQYGQPTDRLEFIPTDDSHQMLRFAVSTDANPFAGYVDALFQDGKPVALYDIFMEPDQRKGGSATKAVKALLDASPDGKLDISNIVTEAQEFWAKMGIPTQPNQPKGYAYDGTITQESFAASDAGKNAGTTRSDLPRGSGVRQAQDGRGRAGRSEESRAGTDGIEVSELTWEQAQAQGLKFSKKQAQQQALDLATPQWQLPDATKTDRLIYELQDGRIDLKRAQEAIAKAGRTITEGFDARLAETLMPGRVAYRTETFLKVEVQPLLEAMARNKVSQDELSDYLLARHAPERNAQISKINPDMPDGGAGTNSQGVLMTTQAARDHIAGLTSGKRTALELLARQVDALTQGTREMLVREGLEKQETIDAWTGAYQNYVPLFKDEAMETPGHPIGSGFSVTGSASKRSTGSSGEVTNMVAHILMQREAAITRAEKNRVAMSLYGLALTHPNAQMWTTVRPSMSDAQIEAELQRMGVDPVEAQSGMQGAPTIRAVDPVTGLVVDRPNPLYKRMDNALVVKVNGEDRVILFNKANPRALRMVQNLKNQDGVIGLDMAGSVVGRATRYLAAINTQYNPAFGMVNIVRDLGGAMVNLTNTPLAGKQARVLGDSIAAMQGIARDLRGDSKRTPWSDLWKQFQEDGGRTGYRALFIDPYKRAESVQGDLDKLSKAGKLTPGAAAHAVLDLLDDFNTTLENGVRLSAYKAALDMGMSRSAAARVARELTLDFNRKGRMGRELGPLYAFFNASIQGTARTVQALKGPAGKRILAGGLSLGVVQALMLAAAGFDDDEIPEFIKARAFIIPMPGKQYIAIPLQFGLNALPNTGRVVTELLMSGGREWQEKTFDAVGELAGSFNPMGGGNIFTASGALKTIAPTVLDPLIEMGTNTGFSGQPIAKERMPWDTRPGFTMGRESTQRAVTGQVYVGISQAINRLTFGDDYTRGLASPAPEHVRYVFTTVGGGVFRELEKALSAAVLTAKGEDLKAREVPLGSRFAGEVDDEQVQRSRYYKNHARMEKLEAKLKGLAKDGKGEELRQFVLDEPAVKLYEANNQVAGELARLNKLAVENITDKEALKRIDAARTNTMRVLNDKVREMEKR